MEKKKLSEILQFVTKIRREAKEKKKTVYSNVYQYSYGSQEEELCDFRMTSTSLIFAFSDKKNVYRAYFVSYDLQELSAELKYFSKGTILECASKGENIVETALLNGGFDRIAIHARKSINFNEEGKAFKRSHADILEPYYNPTVGEYAKEEDAEEIVSLLENVFNRDTDHIPSVEDIKEYASKNWILLYRIKGKIRTLYVYQIQGKKFYSNISYNSSSAIILYCLERRAHEEVIRKYDVTMKYSWINLENERSLRRNILNFDDVYTYIYKIQ